MPVHEVFLAQRRCVADVAGKQVGHLLQIAAVLGLLQKAAYLRRAAEVCDLHAHAAFHTDGAVKLLHKKIHRRAGLLTVDVPEIYCHGRFILRQGCVCAGAQSENKGCRQQQGQYTLFHGLTSGAERVFVDSGAVFREFQKFFPVLSPE